MLLSICLFVAFSDQIEIKNGGGLHLFKESSAGVTDWIVLMSYWWLVQLTTGLQNLTEPSVGIIYKMKLRGCEMKKRKEKKNPKFAYTKTYFLMTACIWWHTCKVSPLQASTLNNLRRGNLSLRFTRRLLCIKSSQRKTWGPWKVTANTAAVACSFRFTDVRQEDSNFPRYKGGLPPDFWKEFRSRIWCLGLQGSER